MKIPESALTPTRSFDSSVNNYFCWENGFANPRLAAVRTKGVLVEARDPRFQMGVLVASGATPLTRMLRGAKSAAIECRRRR
jgi:hypothetical protein